MALCELKNVSKTYGGGAALVHALEDVTLSFEPGEFTVISGPSGSGKSTLLNLVGCLDVPSEGSVWIAGTDVSTLGDDALARLRRNQIGFIFQSFNLVPVLSAAENVETALQLARTPGNRRAMAEEILAQVGLASMVNRRPNQLSGGQQQRVAVARALVKHPAIVIADEPTANLDSHTGTQILDIMRRMNEEHGTTFLFSTHDQMVMGHARRVVRLHDGRVEADDVREPPAAGGVR
jgi:putative ABC transport system ATP-binding protein